MWAMLKALLAQWAILKLLLKSLGSLGWLLPLAFILKAVGLPLLILLGVLAAPLLFVLFLLGLPILLVVVVGGFLLTVTFWLLGIGFAVLKLAIPIILIYWIFRWIRSRGSDVSGTPGTADAT